MKALESVTLKWQQLDEKFSALQMREKILIAVSLIAVIYLAWDAMFASPTAKQTQALSVRFDNANRELQLLSAQEKVLVKALSTDPNAAKRRELMRLEKQLDAANKNLLDMSVGLLSADKLTQVLHDMLKESSRLQLKGMATLPPVKLRLSGAVEDDEPPSKKAARAAQKKPAAEADDVRLHEEEIVGVYKHSVKVSLEGRYFAVIDYLKSLEQLPWRFYWEFIDYEVDRYPQASVSLEVYTLSTEKGVLGG